MVFQLIVVGRSVKEEDDFLVDFLDFRVREPRFIEEEDFMIVKVVHYKRCNIVKVKICYRIAVAASSGQ